jgi:hypothetical protein
LPNSSQEEKEKTRQRRMSRRVPSCTDLTVVLLFVCAIAITVFELLLRDAPVVTSVASAPMVANPQQRIAIVDVDDANAPLLHNKQSQLLDHLQRVERRVNVASNDDVNDNVVIAVDNDEIG